MIVPLVSWLEGRGVGEIPPPAPEEGRKEVVKSAAIKPAPPAKKEPTAKAVPAVHANVPWWHSAIKIACIAIAAAAIGTLLVSVWRRKSSPR